SDHVTVTVDVSNDVTRVDFIVDHVRQASVTSGPFQWDWDTHNFTDNIHTLKVKAFDGQNMVTAQVRVAIDNQSRPTITILTPDNGATLSDSVEVTADAADDVGVTQVRYFIDGVFRGS